MGLSILPSPALKLMQHGLPGNTPAAAFERGITPQQHMVFAVVQDLADKVLQEELVSPTVIIIGKVVALSPSWLLSFKEASCLKEAVCRSACIAWMAMECCVSNVLAIQRFNSLNLIYSMEFLLCWKPLVNRLLIMMVLMPKKGNECAKGSCTVFHLISLVSSLKQSIIMYGCDRNLSDCFAHIYLDRESFWTLTFIMI